MFYTVTLPATLWFFDRAKTDNRILFIDARNIFTQIDRAHREFSDEQILDIAMISRLQRDDRKGFIRLVHRYFEHGMEQLKNNKEKIKEVSKTLGEFLNGYGEKEIPDFASRLEEIGVLEDGYAKYKAAFDQNKIDATNAAQRGFASIFTPFFTVIHDMLKTVDKKVRHLEKEHGNSKETKQVKAELDLLHQEIKDAEYFFTHINWLQERFPDAQYEDVTGLCKCATLDEIKSRTILSILVAMWVLSSRKTEKQKRSLPPKSSLSMRNLQKLNGEARELEAVIDHNIKQLTAEE